jgi:branched-chain amino acid transport system substrate-binding protein
VADRFYVMEHGPGCWPLHRRRHGARRRESWFFITADYAFGHALERDTTDFVRRAGGRVVGAVRTPSRHDRLLLLPAAGAGVARAGDRALATRACDTTNCIKQAASSGSCGARQKLAGLLVFVNDVHSLGLQVAQGLVCTETFYWDLNDRTRAVTRRIRRTAPGQLRPR